MKAALVALVIVTGAALDLATKAWARASLEPYGPASDFLPFVSLRLTFNEGVSFTRAVSPPPFFHCGLGLGLIAFQLVAGDHKTMTGLRVFARQFLIEIRNAFRKALADLSGKFLRLNVVLSLDDRGAFLGGKRRNEPAQ